MEDSAAKNALLSKTYWANLALASAAELSPQLSAWISAHPQTAILACAGINVVLRHFTKGKLTYVPQKNQPPT